MWEVALPAAPGAGPRLSVVGACLGEGAGGSVSSLEPPCPGSPGQGFPCSKPCPSPELCAFLRGHGHCPKAPKERAVGVAVCLRGAELGRWGLARPHLPGAGTWHSVLLESCPGR